MILHRPRPCSQLFTILLIAGLVSGCPEENKTDLCQDVECPALTTCQSNDGRCVAPSEIPDTRPVSHPSLAVAEDGTIYLAVYITDSRDLAVGVWSAEDNQFRLQTVDASGDVGRYPSLALLPDGRPAVAYFDASRIRLKYAFVRDDGLSWQVETADGTASVGSDIDMVIDDDGTSHVSYRDLVNNGLRYAQRLNRVWRLELVDDGSDPEEQIPPSEACPEEQRALIDEGVGFHTHIALQGTTPVISYYDADCGALRLARKGAERWTLRVIDGWSADAYTEPQNPPRSEVGRHNDLGIDAQGAASIVYFDPRRGGLSMARAEGTTPSIEIVDDGIRRSDDLPIEKTIVGQFPAMAFDAEGKAVVGHFDASSRRILLSQQAGDGWLTSGLGVPLEGFDLDMVIDDDGRRYLVGVNRANPDASRPLDLVITDGAAP